MITDSYNNRSNPPTNATTGSSSNNPTSNFAIVPKSAILPYDIQQQQQQQQANNDHDNKITHNDDTNNTIANIDSSSSSSSFLTSIYEQYATLYPNVALQQEYSIRDKLIAALIAADQVQATLNQTKQQHDRTDLENTTKGFFGRLFGSGTKKETERNDKNSTTNTRSKNYETRLQYTDIIVDPGNDHELCGAASVLDTSAIPWEAHSVARYHLACCGNNTNNNNNNHTKNPSIPMCIARHVSASLPRLVSSSVVLITGLGEITEIKYQQQRGFQQQQASDKQSQSNVSIDDHNKQRSGATSTTSIQYTSDRDELIQQNLLNKSQFSNNYTRAAMYGPNFIAISWGLVTTTTGSIRSNVIFYRRLKNRSSSNQQQQQQQQGNQVLWQAVAWMSPTRAVHEQVTKDDVFADTNLNDNGNQLLNISDIVPIVVETNYNQQQQEENNNVGPAACIVVARLGGYIEIVPIPPGIWYGPELDPPPTSKNSNNKKGGRKSNQSHHYLNDIPNLAIVINPSILIAITTSEYHNDIMGMDVISCASVLRKHRKRKGVSTTVNDDELDNDEIPADHILVVHGARNDDNDGTVTAQKQLETISFWSIHTIFDPQIVGIGHTVQIKIAEALDLSTTIIQEHKTIFATETIVQYWRKPRHVELKKEIIESTSDVTSGEDDLTQQVPKSSKQKGSSISISVPLVSVKSSVNSTTGAVRIALLDANGGATILQCDLLMRTVTNTLTDDDVILFQESAANNPEDDTASIVPLVEVIYNRSYILQRLVSSSSSSSSSSLAICLPPRIRDLHWSHSMNGSSGTADDNLVLAAFVQGDVYNPPSLLILSNLFSTSVDKNTILPVVKTTFRKSVALARFVQLRENHELYMLLLESNRKKKVEDKAIPKSKMTVQLCAVHEMHPIDVIQSLVSSKKYIEAIQAFDTYHNVLQQSVATEEVTEIQMLIEQCKRSLWEEQFNITGLELVDDLSYVVEQVVSLIESSSSLSLSPGLENPSIHEIVLNNNVQLFRDACLLALEKSQSVSNVGKHIQAQIVKIRNCLLRLGTYLLLSNYFHTVPHLEHFVREFISIPIVDLALGFAKESLIFPLSILFYRHQSDTHGNWDILNSIALSTSPVTYQHLLPVFNEKNDKIYFMTECRITNASVTEPTLFEYDKFPEHLRQRFEVDIYIDDDDQNNLVSSLRPRLIRFRYNNKLELANWYSERMQSMHKFGSSLDNAYVFGQLAIYALQIHCPEELPNSRTNDIVYEHLCETALISEIARLMTRDMIGRSWLHNGFPLLVEEMRLMNPIDLISFVLNNDIGFRDVGVRYNRYLLPLLQQKVKDESSDDETSPFGAMMLQFCSNCFEGITSTTDENDMQKDLGGSTIVEAMKRCSYIIHQSRTSLESSKRIIQNVHGVIKFVLSTIQRIQAVLSQFTLTVTESKQILESLWLMYESLPEIIPPNLELKDDEVTLVVIQMEQALNQLIIFDLISSWPDENSISMVCKANVIWSSISDHKERGLITAVSCVCKSFCSQVGQRTTSAETTEQRQLVTLLLSDISELCKVFSMEHPADLKAAFLEHFVKPLLLQHQILLIGEFLSKAKPEHVDKDAVTEEVLIHFNELVYGSCRHVVGSDNIRPAVECQEILGQYLPDLRRELQYIRKFVDTAYFINSVLFKNDNSEHIQPAKLRKEFPLDIIESVLEQKPEVAILDSQWGEPLWAAQANKRIRIHNFTKMRPVPDEGNNDAFNDIPTLPGQAVYHIAQLLGLEDLKSAIAVKTRVLFHLQAQQFFGAAAAVSRTLISDMSFARIGVQEAFKLIATLVSCSEYEDIDTKVELCKQTLSQHTGRLPIRMSEFFSKILGHLTRWENQRLFAHGRNRSPCCTVGKFFQDSKMEYPVDLAGLYLTLQNQLMEYKVDEALLIFLARYSFYWCIARSTRPVVDGFGSFEKADTRVVMMIAVYLLFLSQGNEQATNCLNEIVQIFNEQQLHAISMYPPNNWLNPDVEIVRRLIHRGYSEWGARRSAVKSLNTSYDAAVQWAVAHSLDPDFDWPLVGTRKIQEPLVDHDTIGDFSAVLKLANDVLSETRSLSSFLETIGARAHRDGPLRSEHEERTPSFQFIETTSKAIELVNIEDAERENKPKLIGFCEADTDKNNDTNKDVAEDHKNVVSTIQYKEMKTESKQEEQLSLASPAHEPVNESSIELSLPVREAKVESSNMHHEGSVSSSKRNSVADNIKEKEINTGIENKEFMEQDIITANLIQTPDSVGQLAQSAYKLLMLISNLAFNRTVTANQEKAFVILKAHKIEFETLDAADPAYRGLRDELVSVSGIRGKYPQFFLVNLSNGEATFWGNWEKFEQANDDGILVDELSREGTNASENAENTGDDATALNHSQEQSEDDNHQKSAPSKVSTSSSDRSTNILAKSPNDVDQSSNKFVKESPSPSHLVKNNSTPNSKLQNELLRHSETKGKSKNGLPVIKPEVQNTPLRLSKNGEVVLEFLNGTPPGPDSPDRLTFLQAGRQCFERVRSINSPSEAERQRLFEEGRRLLQKEVASATSNGLNYIQSTTVVPIALDPASFTKESISPIQVQLENIADNDITATTLEKPSILLTDDTGWDFDEEDDDISL